jgi:hypothetical protein
MGAPTPVVVASQPTPKKGLKEVASKYKVRFMFSFNPAEAEEGFKRRHCGTG